MGTLSLAYPIVLFSFIALGYSVEYEYTQEETEGTSVRKIDEYEYTQEEIEGNSVGKIDEDEEFIVLGVTYDPETDKYEWEEFKYAPLFTENTEQRTEYEEQSTQSKRLYVTDYENTPADEDNKNWENGENSPSEVDNEKYSSATATIDKDENYFEHFEDNTKQSGSIEEKIAQIPDDDDNTYIEKGNFLKDLKFEDLKKQNIRILFHSYFRFLIKSRDLFKFMKYAYTLKKKPKNHNKAFKYLLNKYYKKFVRQEITEDIFYEYNKKATTKAGDDDTQDITPATKKFNDSKSKSKPDKKEEKPGQDSKHQNEISPRDNPGQNRSPGEKTDENGDDKGHMPTKNSQPNNPRKAEEPKQNSKTVDGSDGDNEPQSKPGRPGTKYDGKSPSNKPGRTQKPTDETGEHDNDNNDTNDGKAKVTKTRKGKKPKTTKPNDGTGDEDEPQSKPGRPQKKPDGKSPRDNPGRRQRLGDETEEDGDDDGTPGGKSKPKKQRKRKKPKKMMQPDDSTDDEDEQQSKPDKRERKPDRKSPTDKPGRKQKPGDETDEDGNDDDEPGQKPKRRKSPKAKKPKKMTKPDDNTDDADEHQSKPETPRKKPDRKSPTNKPGTRQKPGEETDEDGEDDGMPGAKSKPKKQQQGKKTKTMTQRDDADDGTDDEHEQQSKPGRRGKQPGRKSPRGNPSRKQRPGDETDEDGEDDDAPAQKRKQTKPPKGKKPKKTTKPDDGADDADDLQSKPDTPGKKPDGKSPRNKPGKKQRPDDETDEDGDDDDTPVGKSKPKKQRKGKKPKTMTQPDSSDDGTDDEDEPQSKPGRRRKKPGRKSPTGKPGRKQRPGNEADEDAPDDDGTPGEKSKPKKLRKGTKPKTMTQPDDSTYDVDEPQSKPGKPGKKSDEKSPRNKPGKKQSPGDETDEYSDDDDDDDDDAPGHKPKRSKPRKGKKPKEISKPDDSTDDVDESGSKPGKPVTKPAGNSPRSKPGGKQRPGGETVEDGDDNGTPDGKSKPENQRNGIKHDQKTKPDDLADDDDDQSQAMPVGRGKKPDGKINPVGKQRQEDETDDDDAAGFTSGEKSNRDTKIGSFENFHDEIIIYLFDYIAEPDGLPVGLIPKIPADDNETYRVKHNFFRDATFKDLKKRKMRILFYKLFRFPIKSESLFKFFSHAYRHEKKPKNHNRAFKYLIFKYKESGKPEIPDEFFDEYNDKSTKEPENDGISDHRINPNSETIDRKPGRKNPLRKKKPNTEDNVENSKFDVTSTGRHRETGKRHFFYGLTHKFGKTSPDDNINSDVDGYDLKRKFLFSVKYVDMSKAEHRQIFHDFFGFNAKSRSLFDFVKYCHRLSKKPPNHDRVFKECIDKYFALGQPQDLDIFYEDYDKGTEEYTDGVDVDEDYQQKRKFLRHLRYKDAISGSNRVLFLKYFDVDPVDIGIFTFIKFCHRIPRKPENHDKVFKDCLDHYKAANGSDIFDELYDKYINDTSCNESDPHLQGPDKDFIFPSSGDDSKRQKMQ